MRGKGWGAPAREGGRGRLTAAQSALDGATDDLDEQAQPEINENGKPEKGCARECRHREGTEREVAQASIKFPSCSGIPSPARYLRVEQRGHRNAATARETLGTPRSSHPRPHSFPKRKRHRGMSPGGTKDRTASTQLWRSSQGIAAWKRAARRGTPQGWPSIKDVRQGNAWCWY